MMRVATIAVGLGIVVMIITLAVIGGFKTEINNKLSGLSGHIVVTSPRGIEPSAEVYISQSNELDTIIEQVEPTRKSPYILRSAVIRGKEYLDGVVVKGVDSLYNAPFFERFLVEGELPLFGHGGSRRDLLISKDLASRMEVEVGSGIELLFTDESNEEIDRLTFKVAGVYSAGVGEVERCVVIADLETLRKVNGWHNGQISGYELWIEDVNKSLQKSENLNKTLTFEGSNMVDGIAAHSLEELYPSLFDWLKTHDINGVVVVTIMLIVALFNMVTALLILVLERTQMIGILKALGMENHTLQRIFLYRALGVTLRGMVWGNGVGLLLCGVQSKWGVLTLDPTGYMLSEVPIELSVGWILALNAGVLGVILLVMTLPTRMVASVHPDEIVKYR